MKPEALIVEDDKGQSLIFSKAVEEAGYTPRAFGNGAEAMDYLKTHAPALVVLDLHLPGLGGETIAQTMRVMPHLADTKLILATADPRLADTLQELSDLVLLKPVSFIQLRDLAARLLSNM